MLRAGCEKRFNRITVDGDTSTNDCLFLMSSGLAGSDPVQGPGSPLYEPFRTALEAVLESLARAIVSDGEGATKFVAISVRGARNDAEARLAARTVAESPLCKTAFFGSDPNWGRILAALGRSGAVFDPYQVDLDLDAVPWVRKGADNGREKEAAAVIRQKSWTITAHLHNGQSEYIVLTTDLSHKYRHQRLLPLLEGGGNSQKA